MPRTTRATAAAKRNAAQLKSSPSNYHEDFHQEEAKTEDLNSTPSRQPQTQIPSSDQIRRASDDILSGTYLLQAGRNASSLCKRLKEVWEALQHMSSHLQQQEDGVVDTQLAQRLEFVGVELLQDKLLQHRDQHVRSLVACCLVETMRVSAPDSPFGSPEALYRVFQHLMQQINVLASKETTTSTNLHALYVLESLATAKTCVLVVDLDYTPEQHKKPVMLVFFEILFDLLNHTPSVKLATIIQNLLVTCIEESRVVDAPMLDVLLKPLVLAATDEPPSGTSPAHVAREVIRRTCDMLQRALSQYFNDILSEVSEAELKEHVYTLIDVLHTIHPSLLLYVLPNVCLQLQVDDVATRSNALTLLGKLFASEIAEYGQQFIKSFRDFLGRFRDASKAIRIKMIQVSVPIWENKSDLAMLVEKEFILRLSDPEWEVRQLVVREVCDLSANCLNVVSGECLRAVGERMKDKKVALRKETMTGLSQVYNTHISSYWEEQVDTKDWTLSLSHHTIPSDHIKKLGWIPDYVLKSYAYPQQELKLRVIQLLDDFLLPKALPAHIRTNGLVFLYHSLDITSKEALRRVFHERATCQHVVAHFVAFKAQHRSQKRVDESTLERAIHKLYQGLCPLFNDIANLKKLIEKLATWKDHSVFKHMKTLCDESKSLQQTRAARDELVRSVGSKTQLGDFLKKLCRKLSFLTMNQASIACLLDYLLAKKGRQTKENRSVVDLLVMATKELPKLVGPFIRDKVAALLTKCTNDADSDNEDEPSQQDSNVILGAFNILAIYAQYFAGTREFDHSSMNHDESNCPSKELIDLLEKLCRGHCSVKRMNFSAVKENRAAELAALSIAHFYPRTKRTTILIKQLCTKERISLCSESDALPTLQSLHVFSKHCSHQFSENSVLFARLWSLLVDDVIGKKQQSHESGTRSSVKEQSLKNTRLTTTKKVEFRCLAIKVAVNLLVYSKQEVSEDAIKFLALLFQLLRSDSKTVASTPAQAAMFRATASCGLMKMMRNRQLEALVSVSDWHCLGLSLQDASEDVRRQFLKKLTSHLMKQAVQYPHKYLSYLALAATDANTSIKRQARIVLKNAVERMRRVFTALSEISSQEHDSSTTALMVPEYALPYVLHIVAHHPTFPSKLVETTSMEMLLYSTEWSDQLMYLNFFLDGLVSSNAAAADNIAFLLQILTKLTHCHDSKAPNDLSIYALIDTTAVLLKKKIKNQSNLKPFPGKIFLPKHLYGLGRPSTLVTPGGGKEPEASDSLPVRPSRLSASLSPIKPIDFAAHFMKIQSPPGSSLKSSFKKRKRSLLSIDDNENCEMNEMNEDVGNIANSATNAVAMRGRRQSVLGQTRPKKRTFADSSSDSEVEIEYQESGLAPLPRHSIASHVSITDPIVEEKEEVELHKVSKNR
ncbi:hypothetical protein CCR75_003190 [Bremia lactucae]|uniref:Sister chromatid cohesion protein PDS5 n=1 Tax=Bremia lactucae TaxID=4779 RepID=A0A976FLU2_BRELC|nr:hypothetical protein CCR75_003190 [Bremia lactucae]